MDLLPLAAMDSATQVFVLLAAISAVFAPLVAVLWWLIRTAVRQITDEQRRQSVQLGDPAQAGTVAHDVRRAAESADEMHRQIATLMGEAREWKRVAEHLSILDVLQDNLHGRVGNLEQAVISYLGGRVSEAVAEQHADAIARRKAQKRADQMRDERDKG